MRSAAKKAQEIWVFAEQRGGRLHDVALELVSKARELVNHTGGRVSALLLGHQVEGLAEKLTLHGAQRVILLDDPRLEPCRLMPYTSVLAKACREHDPDVVLFGATRMGMELAPRLAARLNTGLSAHCLELQLDQDGRLLQLVPGWGGGVLAMVKCPDHRPQMATVMPGVMKASGTYQLAGELLRLEVGEDLDTSGPRVLQVQVEQGEALSLEQAEVVVAGGWGIGDRDGWKLIDELAAVLCGAVGATRPAVDEGWAREEQMIGQSGKTVRPRLYIGVGISGMMHHLVGMDGSEYIVAINSDPRAPIFEVSDLIVVGDYRAVLPHLIEEIEARCPERRRRQQDELSQD